MAASPGDAALPPGFPPPPTSAIERAGILYASATWSGEALAALARALSSGRSALVNLSSERIEAAWTAALSAFLDPTSPERGVLDPALARFSRLSDRGLQAALEAILGGALEGAKEIFAGTAPADRDEPVLVVLAGNLPALAVQPLLPALARRRPVLLKSPSVEPLFAPALVTALCRREPALTAAVAAASWRGGDEGLETPLLASVGPVLAYGGTETVESLEDRAPGRVVAYGAKTSLAIVSDDADPQAIAGGLARDTALLDQRGCLSIQAIYTAGDAPALADALADELVALAESWPPGPADPAAAAGVHQLRAEAEMRGLYRPDLPVAAGTVVVEPLPEFRPSPGLRTVRVHPLPDLSRLPAILTPWSGSLQGAALAGVGAEALRDDLEALGLSWFAPPGELQSPDARWHNGGIDPLTVL